MEKAIKELLDSRAEARIYIYLVKKRGARSEEIVKGTRLHPSTVRELLSKMYGQKIILRKKMEGGKKPGKRPYLYTPLSPMKLLQKYAKRIENKLNGIVSLTGEKFRVKITYEREK